MKPRAFILPSMALLSVAFVSAADSPAATLVHQIEDGVWLVVMVMLLLFAYTMWKLTQGGIPGLSRGYVVLLGAGVAGLVWKGLGFTKRVFGIENPEWLMDVVRDWAEVVTGTIFAVAFLLIYYAITRVNAPAKGK
jgi:hypothetical protein